MKKYSFYILIISFSFISCYKDLDLEKYRPEPKIVLNSVVSPDTVIMASVSKTVFFTDIKERNISINDATVSLYINNEFKETMLWVDNDKLPNKGIYMSNIKPHTGDLIKIVASSSLGEVWAEDKMPDQIPIQNIKMTYRTISDPNSVITNPDGSVTTAKKYEIMYHITFTDDIKSKNYYCIKIENLNVYQPLGLIDYSLDEVFKAQQSFIDGTSTNKLIEGQGGRTFSDDIINGKTYTMIIRETSESYNYEWGKNLYRKINLFSVSESYYKYLTALLNLNDNNTTQDLTDIGLAEPTPFFSNINGGVGIMGSVQNEYKFIDLRSLFPDYWE